MVEKRRKIQLSRCLTAENGTADIPQPADPPTTLEEWQWSPRDRCI